MIWYILYFNEKIVACALIFNALEEIPFDFICGSFLTLQCFDNGDSDFIHQEFLLLSMTARESEGNTLHLKHVFLWDSTIRITGLISSPLWNRTSTMEEREKEKKNLKNQSYNNKLQNWKFYMHIRFILYLFELQYPFLGSSKTLSSNIKSIKKHWLMWSRKCLIWMIRRQW